MSTRISSSSAPSAERSSPYASAAAVGSLMMRSTSSPAMAPASRVAWRCASLKCAGTVTTARFTGAPKNSSASFFNCWRTIAETCSGASPASISGREGTLSLMSGLSSTDATTLHVRCLRSDCTAASEKLRPMSLLASLMVFVGLPAAWFLAALPTRRVPSSAEYATHDGVVHPPSGLGTISTRPAPARQTATHEYVVPRSIPMTVSVGAASALAPSAVSGAAVPFSFACAVWSAVIRVAFVGSRPTPLAYALTASSALLRVV